MRPPKQFRFVAESYVCVRVTNMRDIDLNRYVFDYDLTFAVLFMNADGTVYHRFGSRDERDAMSWMSMGALLRVMRETLRDHTAYMKNPQLPKRQAKRTILDNPLFRKRDAKKRVDCVHCHTVHDFQRDLARQSRGWSMDDIWIWPPPSRIGLTMDALDQDKVVGVRGDSPAAKAGLRRGDRLVRLGKQQVRTIMDVSFVLDQTSKHGGKLALEFERAGKRKDVELRLAKGWRKGTPLSYSWRSYKWGLDPRPGFGGPELAAAEKRRLGIADQDFAFRVRYLVTWGSHAHTGRNARRSGLRKGDVVVAVDGKKDFHNVSHFHAWVRLKKKSGQVLRLDILRRGKPSTLRLKLP